MYLFSFMAKENKNPFQEGAERYYNFKKSQPTPSYKELL